MNDICYMPATKMAAAIRNKEISPVEILDLILERIKRINPLLNAFITVVENPARERARDAEKSVMRGDSLGPLHGIPVSLKDNIFTKDVRTTYGSHLYENFVPGQDDATVEKLRSAGAIIIGKTNLPEFGASTAAVNPFFGTTANPWNTEKTAGGSSAGAAAAVAAGMGPLALGTDAGGSARVPCSFCGIYGVRPQTGRVDQGPGLRPFLDLGNTCPMTRSVRDAALLLDVIAASDNQGFSKLPPKHTSHLESLNTLNIDGLRLGWSPDIGYAPIQSQVLDTTEKAMSIFADLGSKVEEVKINFEGCEEIFRTIAWAEWYARFRDKLDKNRELLDPNFVQLLEKGKKITIDQYLKAQNQRAEFFVTMKESFAGIDLLVTPTVSTVPFSKGLRAPEEVVPKTGRWSKGWTLFSLPFSLTGQPTASLPCGFTSDGLPVGLQIVGKPFREITVLKASAAFEEAAPWHDYVPRINRDNS